MVMLVATICCLLGFVLSDVTFPTEKMWDSECLLLLNLFSLRRANSLSCFNLDKLLCMYVCMYVCMHACMHACMHVCMYVYIYTYVIWFQPIGRLVLFRISIFLLRWNRHVANGAWFTIPWEKYDTWQTPDSNRKRCKKCGASSPASFE